MFDNIGSCDQNEFKHADAEYRPQAISNNQSWQPLVHLKGMSRSYGFVTCNASQLIR